jgi:hypothetical protein
MADTLHVDDLAPRPISNIEVVVLAVFLLGGANKPVDMEDIAVRANKLAPGRFAWRRHKFQISIEHIRVYLSDAKKPKNGSLLTGDGTKGWQLTSAGLRLALNLKGTSRGVLPSRPRKDAGEERRRRSEVGRISQLPALEKFRRHLSITRREAEEVFRLADYVRGPRRVALIERVRILFVGHPTLEDFVTEMAAHVSSPPPDGDDAQD